MLQTREHYDLQGNEFNERCHVNKITDELTDQACVMGCVFIMSLSMATLLCRKPASIGTAAVHRNLRRHSVLQ